MSVQLPAPRFGRRRLTENRNPVLPLSVLDEVTLVQLAEGFVKTHDVARQLQTLCAERRAQHGESSFPLPCTHILERHAFPKVDMLIGPLSPLHMVDGKDDLWALRSVQRLQKCFRGRPDSLRRYTGRAN